MFEIRPAPAGAALAMAEVRRLAIRGKAVAGRPYPQSVLDTWVAEHEDERVAHYARQIAGTGAIVLVAQADGDLLGFAT
jgi:hypothetical protein